MFSNTFTYKSVERDSRTFHLLTANEYPWINIQVVTFDPSQHDESIATLNRRGGWVVEYPGRTDFAIIHAGGSGKLHFTPSNCNRLTDDMRHCLHNAAESWGTQENIIPELGYTLPWESTDK